MKIESIVVIALALAAASLAAGPDVAVESGTALKPTDLRSEPYRDAIRVGSLDTGDAVEILERSAGWFRVKTPEQAGWVRMLSIRRGEARKADLDLEGILGLASGRTGTGHVVATTGIRGLSEEDLKTAAFNEKDLEEVESLTATPQDAREFAAAGDLIAIELNYLAVPEHGKEKRVWWPR